MERFLRRFSNWLALAGLLAVMVGMLGAARQVRELAMMGPDPAPEGFLPITVDMSALVREHEKAPALAAVSAAPSPTPFQPAAEPQAVGMVESDPAGTEVPKAEGASKAYLPAIVDSLGADTGSITINPVQDPPQAKEPQPTPAPSRPDPVAPDWIDIASVGLSAPVVPVSPVEVWERGHSFEQWAAPNQAAGGWHDRSAMLFEDGNVVINGHHNIYGSVFANLKDVQPGDAILLTGGGAAARYVVAQVMILEERYASLEQRADNARWILPSGDQRLTLVTCWPADSNTHRLIVVARPEGYP